MNNFIKTLGFKLWTRVCQWNIRTLEDPRKLWEFEKEINK